MSNIYVTAPIALTGASQAACVGVGSYRGFALRETTTTAPAVVRIWDNASAASGTILDTVRLSAGESAREFYSHGIRYQKGVYVEVVSGSIEGSVRA